MDHVALPLSDSHYQVRRGQIATYFDRTAADAWARLTSDAPVSGIRATVRAGRDAMRATLLDWLPAGLQGLRVLDAGCGTGALSLELARRGASVLAIDLSPTLVQLARDRIGAEPGAERITFRAGDMLDPALGTFDHVVCMDSLIHYDPEQGVSGLSALAQRTRESMLFTFAPANPLLAAMIKVGRLFPRGDRAPWIVPVREESLLARLRDDPVLRAWQVAGSKRIASGFYTSHAMNLRWREDTE